VNLSADRTESGRPPLRAEVDLDHGLVLVVDGNGELLALTFAEAGALAEEILAVLDAVK
jgi:hypothetical protein